MSYLDGTLLFSFFFFFETNWDSQLQKEIWYIAKLVTASRRGPLPSTYPKLTYCPHRIESEAGPNDPIQVHFIEELVGRPHSLELVTGSKTGIFSLEFLLEKLSPSCSTIIRETTPNITLNLGPRPSQLIEDGIIASHPQVHIMTLHR